eukprot:6398646-Pyramimonas_sp.AAC.1
MCIRDSDRAVVLEDRGLEHEELTCDGILGQGRRSPLLATLSDRPSAYADCVADPLLDYIRRLPPGERSRVENYLRARYRAIESQ